jgi:hypothetical protein
MRYILKIPCRICTINRFKEIIDFHHFLAIERTFHWVSIYRRKIRYTPNAGVIAFDGKTGTVDVYAIRCYTLKRNYAQTAVKERNRSRCTFNETSLRG